MMPEEQGFTLIELIVVIVIGSIISAMFIPFFSTSLIRGSENVNIISESFQINQVIANLTTDYRNRKNAGTLNLPDFYANISSFEENNVTVTAKYVNFRDGSGVLNDSDGDGVYDPLDSAVPTGNLMVTAEKNNQSMRALFTE